MRNHVRLEGVANFKYAASVQVGPPYHKGNTPARILCDTTVDSEGAPVEERRSAERIRLPEPVPAFLGTIPVRIVDLSANGARVHHEERIPIGARGDLRITWLDDTATLRVRVVRSEIAGRAASGLLYNTGIAVDASSPEADGLIHAILHAARPLQTSAEKEPEPALVPPLSIAPFNPFSRDDDAPEPEFVRCEFIGDHWKVSPVSSPEQPAEGFTLARDRSGEIRDLQRVYEIADPETRSMMRTALTAQLAGVRS